MQESLSERDQLEVGGLDLRRQLDRKIVIVGIAHGGEAAIIQHFGDCLPHLQHHVADLAGRLVAILAALILRAAGARDWRQRPVKHAHDMADLDFGGRPGKAVAAFLAFAALDEAGIAQLAQDGVEKFLRDVVAGGDVVDEGELPGRQSREVDKRLEAVLTFFGEHEIKFSLACDGMEPSVAKRLACVAAASKPA